MIAGGTFGAPISYPNYTELSYFNETLPGSPTTRDRPDHRRQHLARRRSTRASPRRPSRGVPARPDTVLPCRQVHGPRRGDLDSHGDNADYAGIFAADTRGVFIGEPAAVEHLVVTRPRRIAKFFEHSPAARFLVPAGTVGTRTCAWELTLQFS